MSTAIAISTITSATAISTRSSRGRAVPGSGVFNRNTHFSNPNKDNTGYEGDR